MLIDRPLRRLFALLVLAGAPSETWAWGQEGHSVVAEIAQRRLSPLAAREVARVLGAHHSLAAISSWADDHVEARPETFNWHFVNIPLASGHYDAARDCAPTPKGDCIVAELERLATELRCADGVERKRDALKFAVHLVGDIHQPFHTVLEDLGGNTIAVTANMTGLLACGGKPCTPDTPQVSLHAVWDFVLLRQTTRDWGAYVDRLENGWLRDAVATPEVTAGTPVTWAEETHARAQEVWKLLPADRVLGEDYYREALPFVDRQLGLAGLRLARFLNEAYESNSCPPRQ